MNKNSSDDTMCWLCDYWWIIVIILLIVAVGYFTFPYWGPFLAL
jgi:hypothetical protein